MKFKSRNVYMLLTCIYTILTIIELVLYFINDSSLFGLIYLLINIAFIFVLFTLTINYDKYDQTKRIILVLILMVVGLLSSFALNPLIDKILPYTIENNFVEKIYLTKCIFKPIIYVIFIALGMLELKVINMKKGTKISQKSIKIARKSKK